MKWFKDFGKQNMTTLTSGMQAPDFSLSTLDGKNFSLREALSGGPVIAAFFKISCPVCQFAFPFLDRIYGNLGGKHVSFIGVSQNDKKDTSVFVKQYGVTFPVLLDDTKTFAVSNTYGLTNVPTVFWIAQDGEIRLFSAGWSRHDIEEISRMAADANGYAPKPLFRADEKIAEFRPG